MKKLFAFAFLSLIALSLFALAPPASAMELRCVFSNPEGAITGFVFVDDNPDPVNWAQTESLKGAVQANYEGEKQPLWKPIVMPGFIVVRSEEQDLQVQFVTESFETKRGVERKRAALFKYSESKVIGEGICAHPSNPQEPPGSPA